MSNAQTQYYDRELQLAVGLAREAGAAILQCYDKPIRVEQKEDASDFEPVTQADRTANELIVRAIRDEFPDDGILAEESVDTDHRLEKSRVWVIDPLDGTTGFIKHDGDFAVQIGLAVNGAPLLGVVYQPLPGVLYRAVQGGGSWIERAGFTPERGLVGNNKDPQSMRLAASRSHRSPRMDQVVNAFGFKEEVRRGSVGVKIGLIIEQQCDLYIHLSPRTKQWDTCAPEIILRESGGRLTDLFGGRLRYNSPEVKNQNGIVATNGAAHSMVVEKLAPLLKTFGRQQV